MFAAVFAGYYLAFWLSEKNRHLMRRFIDISPDFRCAWFKGLRTLRARWAKEVIWLEENVTHPESYLNDHAEWLKGMRKMRGRLIDLLETLDLHLLADSPLQVRFSEGHRGVIVQLKLMHTWDQNLNELIRLRPNP